MTTNLINGKKYIGQTKRNDNSYLGSGKLIKAAILKYGRENFSRTILHESFNIDELNKMEIYYISFYNATDDPEFYNIQKGGKQSAQVNKKISETRLLKQIGKGENNSRAKEYDLNSPTGGRYRFKGRLKLFAKENNLYSVKLSQLSRGIITSYRGWTTNKIEERIVKQKSKHASTGKKLSESHKNKIKETTKICSIIKKKTFSLISPEGIIINGTGRYEFCKQYHLSFPSLLKLIKGQINECKGWKVNKL